MWDLSPLAEGSIKIDLSQEDHKPGRVGRTDLPTTRGRCGEGRSREDLEPRHLQRLLIAEGSATLLVVDTLSLGMNFSFDPALQLDLLAGLGSSRTIGLLGRESD